MYRYCYSSYLVSHTVYFNLVLWSHHTARIMFLEEDYHRWTCWALLALAPVVFVALHFGGQKAAYGRYSLGASGGSAGGLARLLTAPVIPGRLDWFLHSTSLLAVAFVWRRVGDREAVPPGSLVLLGCFLLHYVWRSFIFAVLVKQPKPMTLPLGMSTSGFCLMNGWLQGSGLLLFSSTGAAASALVDIYAPRFLLGVAVFFLGWLTNVSSDLTLINLRKSPADKNYYIPTGGLFEWVSGANFLGEIVEWGGFALASGFARAPLAFAVFTAANLAPRALQHHQWYKDKFKDEYPKARRGLIPYLW